MRALPLAALALAGLAACAPAPAPPASPSAAGPPVSSAPADDGTVEVVSAQYGYAVRVPDDWTVRPATLAWDGGDIDHTADYADRFSAPSGEEVFVLGRPTTDALADVAAEHAAWLSSARGCPEPETVTPTTLDGVAAERLVIRCPEGVFGPTLVSKVIAVVDDRAIIVTAFTPDDGTSASPALEAFLPSVRWRR